MTESNRYLNKLVIAKTAQGQIQFVGRCVSYTAQPTISVRLPDGTQANWIAAMCTVVDIDEKALDLMLLPSHSIEPQLGWCTSMHLESTYRQHHYHQCVPQCRDWKPKQ
jgi:hypothetical protein